MRALVWNGAELRLTERTAPAATDGMAVVRVHLAGVCRTDLEIVKGYMGFTGVLGHEFVGTVAVGPDGWRDERVVAEINFECGACDTCLRGLGRHCPHRRVLGIEGADGAFAEYVAVPVRNLHRVPDGVADEAAVFTEPLAAAFEIFEQIEIPAGKRVVVLGDGRLGLLVAQVLDRTGARVLLAGKHPAKLAIAAARGIETTLVGDGPPAPAGLVIEATGSIDGLRLALDVVEPRGTLVLKSTIAGSPSVDLSPLVIKEISLVGSRCGPFPPALSLLANEEVDVRPLVSARLPLARADEALRRASVPGALKVLIDAR